MDTFTRLILFVFTLMLAVHGIAMALDGSA